MLFLDMSLLWRWWCTAARKGSLTRRSKKRGGHDLANTGCVATSAPVTKSAPKHCPKHDFQSSHKSYTQQNPQQYHHRFLNICWFDMLLADLHSFCMEGTLLLLSECGYLEINCACDMFNALEGFARCLRHELQVSQCVLSCLCCHLIIWLFVA